MPKCPKCKSDMDCLGGCSAHPDNWYCDACGYKAWEPKKRSEPAMSEREMALEAEVERLRKLVRDEQIAMLREALEPFAKCADWLDETEDTPAADDEEWAKFRLIVKDYRVAREALALTAPDADGGDGWRSMESAPRDDVIDIWWELGDTAGVSACEWVDNAAWWGDLCDQEIMPPGIKLRGWKPRREPPADTEGA